MSYFLITDPYADPERRGHRGFGPPPPPLNNRKNIGCLCNTGPDPLKTKTAFHVEPSLARPANHHLNEVSLAG